jgi:formate dehydrogenase major subunit
LTANPARLTRPLVRKDGALQPASWEEALSAVAAGLKAALAAGGLQAVGVLGSARATNEDNYVLARFARATLGTPNLDCSHRTGSLPTSGQLADLEQSDLFVLVGNDPNEEHPAVSARLYRGQQRGARILAISTRRHPLARLAEVHVPSPPGGEADALRALLRLLLSKTEALGALKESVAEATPEAVGVSAEVLAQAVELYASASRVTLLYSVPLAVSSRATAVLAGFAALGEAKAGPPATLFELLSRNNLRGCLDMGVCPDHLPGYVGLDEPGELARVWGDFSQARGLPAWEMPGKVKALYVMGDDLTRALPGAELGALDFLVVQDIFLSPLAKLAHVVLPAAAFGEREGTVTNQERRVQRTRKAVDPPGEAREDWRIVAEVSARLGKPLPYTAAEGIFAEIARVAPIYGGLSYAGLEQAGGVIWPAEAAQGAFAWQREAQAVPQNGAARRTSEEFPFLLLADASLGPWEDETSITSTLTVAVEFTITGRDYPTGLLCLHPDDAKELGVRPGRNVQVRSAQGEATMRVQVSEDTLRGVALVPHWQAARLGVLPTVSSPGTGRPALAPTPVAITSA